MQPFTPRGRNVKTAKEQMFHKHFANVPTSNRNETKMSEFVPQSFPAKEIISICPGEQILDQIETICSQQDKFRNDTKTFWFRFQNDIGTFVLPFLTLLPRGGPTGGTAVGNYRVPPTCMTE
jgi:hypothetical protein